MSGGSPLGHIGRELTWRTAASTPRPHNNLRLRKHGVHRKYLAVFIIGTTWLRGRADVQRCTRRVPSACIPIEPRQGLPMSTGEGARLFLYRNPPATGSRREVESEQWWQFVCRLASHDAWLVHRLCDSRLLY